MYYRNKSGVIYDQTSLSDAFDLRAVAGSRWTGSLPEGRRRRSARAYAADGPGILEAVRGFFGTQQALPFREPCFERDPFPDCGSRARAVRGSRPRLYWGRFRAEL